MELKKSKAVLSSLCMIWNCLYILLFYGKVYLSVYCEVKVLRIWADTRIENSEWEEDIEREDGIEWKTEKRKGWKKSLKSNIQ